MNPPNLSSRRGPLLVLSLVFIALLVLPVVIATVGVDQERDAASASATTTEAPTTADPSTTSAPAATTTEPAPTTTEATVPETTTTVDMDEVYEFAAAYDRSTSTTTTAAPVPVTAPPVVEAPVVEVASAPEPAPVEEPPAPPAPTYGGDPFANLSQSDIDFLACVRNRESGGDYTAVNPSSGAGGAYQFLIDTWNNTAAHAGRSDLIGTSPQWASPYDQDVIAADLITWYGRSPWSYSCY